MVRMVQWVALAGLAASCGGEAGDFGGTVEPVQVWAEPSGRRFDEGLEVKLRSAGAVEIYFTRDGSSPTREDASEYTGPIWLEQSSLLTFVAVGPDGRTSALSTELYQRNPVRTPYRPPARGLEVSTDVLFFLADPEETELEQTIHVRSVGLDPVGIHGITIVPRGAYFEPGVFTVSPAEPTRLAPGDRLELVVRYRTTPMLRTAALVLDSDDERALDGRWEISLGGRIGFW